MEDFSRSSWIKHKKMLIGSGSVMFAFLTYFMLRPAGLGYMFASMVVGLLLSCPFTFKKARGRLWWDTALILFASAFAAVKLGMQRPLGWLFALISACAYAMGVCLRWHDPAIRSRTDVAESRPLAQSQPHSTDAGSIRDAAVGKSGCGAE